MKHSDLMFTLSLIDLTSLNDADTHESTRQLARDAVTPLGTVAALCVYTQFVATAKAALAMQPGRIRVATVANFPGGHDDFRAAATEVAAAVAAGADEVDVVFPWRALLAGNEQSGRELVAACRDACGDRVLKVIIESGCLGASAQVRRASELAIEGGAQFIKTSTGKVAVNATLHAAEVMLETIRDSGQPVGFKASGGIRTAEEAERYLALAKSIMGCAWPQLSTFRFGASGLLQDLLRKAGLGVQTGPVARY